MTKGSARDGSGVPHHPAVADSLFTGPGEMRALCRDMDWSATPLGPSARWPISLRATVAIVLGSRNPMFLFWGPELVQIYNDAYRPSLGAAGPLGRHPRALGARGREFWTDIWTTIGPQIEQVMTTGVATWHEDQYLPIERNGAMEDVWWTYSYGPVCGDDGRVSGVLVVCQETTARVLAENEREALLQQTERAHRRNTSVLDQIADEHMTMDADFRILTVNRAATQALGRDAQELVGLTHWEAFPASLGTRVEEVYRGVMRDRVEAHITHHYVGEGYDRHLEIDAYPTEEGGLALFWRDISQRVRAEAALRESEAQLRGIYDATYEYIGLITVDGTVLDCNRASLAFAGSRREDIVGLKLWDAPWFEHTPAAAELLRSGVQLAANGEFVRHELTLRKPTGEDVTFDFSLHPVRNDAGAVIYIVPEGRDITERKQAEVALRARRSEIERLLQLSETARTEAEAANSVKTKFLRTMSHELRTPLNAISGYAELLQMGVGGTLSAEQMEFIGRIQASQLHLLGLINEVLNFARLETGSVTISLVPVSVQAVLREAHALISPQARNRNVAAPPPCAADTIRVMADEEKLRQIVVNLLSNAVKFTPAGGAIRMECEHAGEQVLIRVIDSGIGIADDHQQRIFEPFVQINSDLTRPYEGTGLGLAISRDLAIRMGGELTVASAPGAGSTFTLSMPVAPVAPPS